MSDGKINWQHSGSQPRLIFIDARSTVILLITLLHITLFTLILSFLLICILTYIEKWKRITPESALRLLGMSFMNLLIGNKRCAFGPRRKIYYSDKRICDITGDYRK